MWPLLAGVLRHKLQEVAASSSRRQHVNSAALALRRASPPHPFSTDLWGMNFLGAVKSAALEGATLNPRSPGEIRAKPIQCLQVGHIGRSTVENELRTHHPSRGREDIHLRNRRSVRCPTLGQDFCLAAAQPPTIAAYVQPRAAAVTAPPSSIMRLCNLTARIETSRRGTGAATGLSPP